eukprot:CAMPEP_0194285596 /NCGR_PEP_ID=MMETSP0169-20130528/30557_1 /TAXON_ID=218684 /ORGANISM="Corethron pennatum, Strain L29A3" /LENGTH=1256 /DNA_ID=CAMNT_0039031765 /DNA_START=63 /DNA_END=3833 /DNA_ORIENTATION=-
MHSSRHSAMLSIFLTAASFRTILISAEGVEAQTAHKNHQRGRPRQQKYGLTFDQFKEYIRQSEATATSLSSDEPPRKGLRGLKESEGVILPHNEDRLLRSYRHYSHRRSDGAHRRAKTSEPDTDIPDGVAAVDSWIHEASFEWDRARRAEDIWEQLLGDNKMNQGVGKRTLHDEYDGSTIWDANNDVSSNWLDQNITLNDFSSSHINESGLHFPFIFCVDRPDWNGYRRKMYILETLSFSRRKRDGVRSSFRHEYSPDFEEARGGTTTDLVNTDSITCIMKHTRASVADRVANYASHNEVSSQVILVHPISPLMKMRRGTIDYAIAENIEQTDKEGSEITPASFSFNIRSCSHVVLRTDDDDSLSRDDLPDIANEGKLHIEHKIRRLVNRLGKNFDDRKQSESKNHSSEENIRRKLRQSFFWGSTSFDKDFASTTKESYKELIDGHDFWKNVFDIGIDSKEGCDSVLDKFEVSSELVGDATLSITFPNNNRAWGDTMANEDNGFNAACVLSVVAAVSALPDVCFIAPKILMKQRDLNLHQSIIQGSTSGHKPIFNSGITGEGQIVAISDSGLDTNHCYFRDADGEDVYDNIAFTNRKIIQYIPYSDGVDFSGHGTAIASIIAGRRSFNGSNESNGRADGVAINAKLSFFDIGNSNGGLNIPQNAAVFLDPGRRAGAKIHNVSWGSDSYSDQNSNEYQSLDMDMDKYIADNDDFNIIVAAGNEGSFCPCGRGNCESSDECSFLLNYSNSVSSPAIAKNVITVGASQTKGGYESYINPYSARGPTKDGRIAPMLVAPGQDIVAAKSIQNKVGECDISDGGLTKQTGTSMSAAVISGGIALIREYFVQGFYPSTRRNLSHSLQPSSALIKALLINGALPMVKVDNSQMNGNDISTTSYDFTQGFGRVSLVNTLPLYGLNSFGMALNDRRVIQQGDTHTYPIKVDPTCSTRTVTVTLVWTDKPAGEWCTKCLLNDLDLYIFDTVSQTKFFPNGLVTKDSLNNAERIVLNVGTNNDLVAYVAASNLVSPRQNYALVISGCVTNPKKGSGSVPYDSNGGDANSNKSGSGSVPSDSNGKDVNSNKSALRSGVSPQGDVRVWSNKLTTSSSFTHVTDGSMFEIYASSNTLIINGLDVHLHNGGREYVEIWTRYGSYVGYEHSKSAWRYLGGAYVESVGANGITQLPKFPTAVLMKKGEKRSFYVTTATRNIMVKQSANKEGWPFISNEDVTISTGIGNIHRFGDVSVSPFEWKGAVHYETSREF